MRCSSRPQLSIHFKEKVRNVREKNTGWEEKRRVKRRKLKNNLSLLIYSFLTFSKILPTTPYFLSMISFFYFFLTHYHFASLQFAFSFLPLYSIFNFLPSPQRHKRSFQYHCNWINKKPNWCYATATISARHEKHHNLMAR